MYIRVSQIYNTPHLKIYFYAFTIVSQSIYQDNDIINVATELIVPEAMEFPRIDYRNRGKEYKYFYALGNDYLHPNKVCVRHY